MAEINLPTLDILFCPHFPLDLTEAVPVPVHHATTVGYNTHKTIHFSPQYPPTATATAELLSFIRRETNERTCYAVFSLPFPTVIVAREGLRPLEYCRVALHYYL